LDLRTSREERHSAYGAVGHRVDGKGNGPTAEALKMPPSDLTTLAKEKMVASILL